jgi:hypothetical protein
MLPRSAGVAARVVLGMTAFVVFPQAAPINTRNHSPMSWSRPNSLGVACAADIRRQSFIVKIR